MAAEKAVFLGDFWRGNDGGAFLNSYIGSRAMPEFAPKTRELAEMLDDPDFAGVDLDLAQSGEGSQQRLLSNLASKLATARAPDDMPAADLARLLRVMQACMEAESLRAEQADEDLQKLRLQADSGETERGKELEELREELADEKAAGKKTRAELRALEEQLKEREAELREKSEEIEDTRGFMKKEAFVSGAGGRAAEQMRQRISQLEEELRNAQARAPAAAAAAARGRERGRGQRRVLLRRGARLAVRPLQQSEPDAPAAPLIPPPGPRSHPRRRTPPRRRRRSAWRPS